MPYVGRLKNTVLLSAYLTLLTGLSTVAAADRSDAASDTDEQAGPELPRIAEPSSPPRVRDRTASSKRATSDRSHSSDARSHETSSHEMTPSETAKTRRSARQISDRVAQRDRPAPSADEAAVRWDRGTKRDERVAQNSERAAQGSRRAAQSSRRVAERGDHAVGQSEAVAERSNALAHRSVPVAEPVANGTPQSDGQSQRPSPIADPANLPLDTEGQVEGDSFDPHQPDSGDGLGCSDCCDEGCNACCPQHGPIYFRGEYLLWWIKGAETPALVTTSPQGTARDDAGVLGQTGTTVLFGNQPVSTNSHSGARLTLGKWLDTGTRIEGSYFFLGQSRQDFNQSSTGNPILARPYFDVNPASATPAAENSVVLAFPGQLTGAINIHTTSSLLGADLRVLHNIFFADYTSNLHYRLDFLTGYRFLQLRDSLDINSTVSNAQLPAQLNTHDSFRTRNSFHGADLGLVADWRYGRWDLQTIGRFGLGATSERVTIAGSNSSVNPAGGVLAQASNIGSYHHSGFAVVPQLELKLGYDLTQRLRFNVGYDWIYWTRVARPGDQIDRALNLSQASGGTLNGSPRPAFGFQESQLWVQGISVGGEYRF